jgi:hypothetical protein
MNGTVYPFAALASSLSASRWPVVSTIVRHYISAARGLRPSPHGAADTKTADLALVVAA